MLLVHINLDRKVVGGSNIWQQTQMSVKTTIDNYLCQTLQVLDIAFCLNSTVKHVGTYVHETGSFSNLLILLFHDRTATYN